MGIQKPLIHEEHTMQLQIHSLQTTTQITPDCTTRTANKDR